MLRFVHVCVFLGASVQVPFKNGSNKEATPSADVDHEYELVSTGVNKSDPHYKVSHYFKSEEISVRCWYLSIIIFKDLHVGSRGIFWGLLWALCSSMFYRKCKT